MQRTNRKALLGALSALALTAVAMPAAAQVRAPGEPPLANTAEAGLWGMFERAEIEARKRGDLNKDPALNAYVSDLTCRLAADHCQDIRVYVMDRPILNAQAASNGYVEVWSGLMLRAETEDELAFVLGHEIAHFLEEHSYERLRAHRNAMTAAMVVSVAAAGVGAYYQVDVSGVIDAAYLGAVSTYFGFSRANESQSDEMGVGMAHKIGLDPASAANMWRNQQAETKASTFPRVRRSEAAGSVFRSHPLTQDRVSSLEAQAKVLGGKPATLENRKAYRAVIRPHLNSWIEDEHRHRDFGRLLHLLDRLGADGEDLGVINYQRGEVYRRRREEGDDLLAATAYRVAVAHADAPFAAYRELGTLEARMNNRDAARDAFNKYRQLAPDADDLWIVEEQLSRLEGDN